MAPKYGPLVSFQFGSRLMVSIASHDICQDLMARKGSLYSIRLDIMVAAMAGPQGILASVTTENNSRKYRLLEEVESLQIMIDLLLSDDFPAIFRYGATVHNALG
ncbi:cytochrome P450 [Penicillium canescens]|nr:cytochrome P450 [Penicillium canescens]